MFGRILSKNNHESCEFRWIVLPETGLLVPVMCSSDLPVSVTVVFVSEVNDRTLSSMASWPCRAGRSGDRWNYGK